jgi:hypothetical protein
MQRSHVAQLRNKQQGKRVSSRLNNLLPDVGWQCRPYPHFAHGEPCEENWEVQSTKQQSTSLSLRPCRIPLKTVETTINQSIANQTSSLLLGNMPAVSVVVLDPHAAGQMHGKL